MTFTRTLTVPVLTLVFGAVVFTSVHATGSERHHYAPIQRGVKINKPELSPVEQKIQAMRNLIAALRKAKTNHERNGLLNSQAANLDELEAMLQVKNVPMQRLTVLERRVDELQAIVERLQLDRGTTNR